MYFKALIKHHKLLKCVVSNRNYYTVNTNIVKKKNEEILKTFCKRLQQKIKVTGPMTVSEYMREVLTNPIAGYYMHKDVFGRSGDFVTSPELGQLFGEMTGVWFLNEWRKIGSPKPLQIIELGPGRGSLSQDITKVFKHFNELQSISLHLVEVSPFLADTQARKLCLKSEKVEDSNATYYQKGVTSNGTCVTWYQNLKDVPNEFSAIIAHEFFDALPIHKFQRTDDGWREVLVGLGVTEDEFKFTLSNQETATCKLLVNKNESREHVEISVEAVNIMKEIVKRVEQDGGLALIADYGHVGEKTDTFRAFKDHRLHDPLHRPGTADLTADVDFQLLKAVAANNDAAICFGPVTQKQFLIGMGISERLEQLMENASEDQAKALKFAYEMMTDDDQMGTRFKFLSVFPGVLKQHLKKYPVAGFS